MQMSEVTWVIWAAIKKYNLSNKFTTMLVRTGFRSCRSQISFGVLVVHHANINIFGLSTTSDRPTTHPKFDPTGV